MDSLTLQSKRNQVVDCKCNLIDILKAASRLSSYKYGNGELWVELNDLDQNCSLVPDVKSFVYRKSMEEDTGIVFGNLFVKTIRENPELNCQSNSELFKNHTKSSFKIHPFHTYESILSLQERFRKKNKGNQKYRLFSRIVKNEHATGFETDRCGILNTIPIKMKENIVPARIIDILSKNCQTMKEGYEGHTISYVYTLTMEGRRDFIKKKNGVMIEYRANQTSFNQNTFFVFKEVKNKLPIELDKVQYYERTFVEKTKGLNVVGFNQNNINTLNKEMMKRSKIPYLTQLDTGINPFPRTLMTDIKINATNHVPGSLITAFLEFKTVKGLFDNMTPYLVYDIYISKNISLFALVHRHINEVFQKDLDGTSTELSSSESKDCFVFYGDMDRELQDIYILLYSLFASHLSKSRVGKNKKEDINTRINKYFELGKPSLSFLIACFAIGKSNENENLPFLTRSLLLIPRHQFQQFEVDIIVTGMIYALHKNKSSFGELFFHYKERTLDFPELSLLMNDFPGLNVLGRNTCDVSKEVKDNYKRLKNLLTQNHFI